MSEPSKRFAVAATDFEALLEEPSSGPIADRVDDASWILSRFSVYQPPGFRMWWDDALPVEVSRPHYDLPF